MPNIDFNSTMVRLKVNPTCRNYVVNITFQFHYGSVKSSPRTIPLKRPWRFQFHYGSVKRPMPSMAASSANRFQFHYGSVKSFASKRYAATPAHFNSTMVRLKAKTWNSTSVDVTFQFHYGSVKSICFSDLSKLLCYFNSTMVRLKAFYRFHIIAAL